MLDYMILKCKYNFSSEKYHEPKEVTILKIISKEMKNLQKIVKGGEISVDYKAINTLDISSSFSMVRGEKNNGSYLAFMPADKIICTIKFDLSEYFSNEDTFLSIGIRNYRKQDRVTKEEIPTLGYTLVDAGFGTDIFLFNLKFRIILNATNLLDKKYYDHLSLLKPLGVLDMGRNISLSINIPFEVK